MIKTVLFDLDGTLLPMDQEEFIKTYFYELTKRMQKVGFEPGQLTKWVWEGTRAMMVNDGQVTNREVFYKVFEKISGHQSDKYEPVFDQFYKEEFDSVKRILGPSYGQKEMIDELQQKGIRVILATAPVFPRVAVETRLSWIGLASDDFDYITSYENSTYCKPNPAYYQEIFDKNGCDPKECLMVGNNAREDTGAAKLGADMFLLTDYLEKTGSENVNKFKNGNVDDLKSFLAKIG